VRGDRLAALRVPAVAVSLAFGAVACSGGHGGALSPTQRQVEPALGAPTGFSGVELVSRGGSIIAERGFSSSGAVPSPSSTVFDIGSIGKSFTAAAVLQLVSDGRLRLAEHLSSILPGVSATDRAITIYQLLTHTSGLPLYFASDQATVSERQGIRAIGRLRRATPGRFRYSDAGYTLLAAVVQQVSGEPFRTYVEHHLFAPAGLMHTGWYGEPAPNGTTTAHSYVNGVDRGAAGQEASPSWSTLGAGGIVSTAADLSRWASALLDHRVLNARTTRMLFAPRVPLPRAPPGTSVAFGWITGRTPAGRPLLAVGGGTDYGFTADVRIYPTLNIVTVVLANDSVVPALQVGTRLGSTLPR
jgi:CubicO group peptidase (beta-lactamase class C family)